MKYALCKNPVQLDTLNIVRYLHSIGVEARPSVVYERNHPAWATCLPAVLDLDTTMRHCGFDAVVRYLEDRSGVCDLALKPAVFDSDYTIKGNATLDRVP